MSCPTARAAKPIVIADTQDNPGGGGHGDTTGLLVELVRQQAKGAVLCLINDAESVAACQAAGEGSALSLALGGKSDGLPFDCTARVRKLTDGRFTMTGPMGAGNPGNLRDRCRPVLLRLSASLGDTVFLMVRAGFDALPQGHRRQ